MARRNQNCGSRSFATNSNSMMFKFASINQRINHESQIDCEAAKQRIRCWLKLSKYEPQLSTRAVHARKFPHRANKSLALSRIDFDSPRCLSSSREGWMSQVLFHHRLNPSVPVTSATSATTVPHIQSQAYADAIKIRLKNLSCLS